MVSFSLLGLQHPEPNGSRRATPTSTFQHRPGHLLPIKWAVIGDANTEETVEMVVQEIRFTQAGRVGPAGETIPTGEILAVLTLSESWMSMAYRKMKEQIWGAALGMAGSVCLMLLSRIVGRLVRSRRRARSTRTAEKDNKRACSDRRCRRDSRSINACIDRILNYLNRVKTRCTYKAVGDVVGVPAQSVGKHLGQKRPEASWVVGKKTGQPTGYETSQKHPDLCKNQRIIMTGEELRKELTR